MSTTTRTDPMRREFWRSRWWMPAFSLFLGLLLLGAFWLGDNLGDGLRSFAVMAVVAAVFAFGATRSETLGGLGGPARDERWSAIDLRATAFAGMVALTVVLGSWVVEIAQGEDGSPYGEICAITGIAYIVAVAFLRFRS